MCESTLLHEKPAEAQQLGEMDESMSPERLVVDESPRAAASPLEIVNSSTADGSGPNFSECGMSKTESSATVSVPTLATTQSASSCNRSEESDCRIVHVKSYVSRIVIVPQVLIK
jgi:hypothetical protein